MTIGEAIADLTARFAAAGLDTPRLDARVLVGHLLALSPSRLFARSGDLFPVQHLSALASVIERRLAHEPVSRIRGMREFWGLDFLLGPETLDPRPDTETLVEAALALRDDFNGAGYVLDLGTGPGSILLAILSDWPAARGLGIDLSADAIRVARVNAERLGLAARATFTVGHWCDGIDGPFHIVVSNPPYITNADFDRLAPEVAKFDPALALRGGPDGLTAYRAIIPAIAPILAPHGAFY